MLEQNKKKEEIKTPQRENIDLSKSTFGKKAETGPPKIEGDNGKKKPEKLADHSMPSGFREKGLEEQAKKKPQF